MLERENSMSVCNIGALKDCVLKDEVITVPGLTDSLEYMRLGDMLRKDILSLEVPHWKVVGVKITVGDRRVLSNYIDKQQGVSKSYAELLASLRFLILADRGGFPHTFTMRKAELGGKKCIMESSFIVGNGKLVTSNSGMFYDCAFGHKPESLIPNVEIVRFARDDSRIELLLHRGTKTFTFREAGAKVKEINQEISMKKEDNLFYAPIEQDYDLTEVFSIKRFELGDKGIYLRYKSKLNENVLQQIIRDYAREMEILQYS